MMGWVKLHRAISGHWVYGDSQAFHLWVHLILSANHQGRKIIDGNEVIEVKRGQLLTSLNALNAATRISRSKCGRLLNIFEKEQMLEQQQTAKYRLVTISNYDKYQNSETPLEQEWNADETPLEPNNNGKNKKKGKKAPSKNLEDVTLNDLLPWVEEKKSEGINFGDMDFTLELARCKAKFQGEGRKEKSAQEWMLRQVGFTKERQQKINGHQSHSELSQAGEGEGW